MLFLRRITGCLIIIVKTSDNLSSIYDAALDPGAWPAALTQLARLFRAGFADKFARTHDGTCYQGVAIGLDDDDYQQQFLGVWSKRNVWAACKPVTKAGEILTTREILPKPKLVKSEMYADYLHPRGLHEGMRLAIWSGPHGIEDISLLRPWSMGAYTARERGLATALMPHLRRSAALSRRVAEVEATSLASTAALEQIRLPVLLLDMTGRIVLANRSALELLRQADGLAASAAGLSAATASATVRLQAALRETAGARGRRLSTTVRLPRPSGQPDLVFTAIPLNPGSGIMPLQPAILAFISDPAAELGSKSERLSAFFGFTPAEAALAQALLKGENLASIAHRTNRSVNTVRTHLARLMAKTGTSRQSELLLLLGRTSGQVAWPE